MNKVRVSLRECKAANARYVQSPLAPRLIAKIATAAVVVVVVVVAAYG